MKRAELKAIVKECLLEILSEGLGQGLVETTITRQHAPHPSSLTSQPSRPVKQVIRAKDPYLDSPVRQPNVQSQALRNAITEASGGDSTLASIFEDTARTTLPEMIANDSQRPTAHIDMASRIVEAHDPADVFGDEAASKWAALAFAPPVLPGIKRDM